MSKEQGYVRVVNIRSDDEDFRAVKGERVITMDRTNPTMGNRHVMTSQTRLERERVIEAHLADLEADVQRKGPMHQTMMAIAFDIVDRNDKVALQCFCAPKPCHLDAVASHIAKMVEEIRADASLGSESANNPSSKNSRGPQL
jgi:hypothetical protein